MKSNEELLEAVNTISIEKKIQPKLIFQVIKEGILKVYEKYDPDAELQVDIDEKIGKIDIYKKILVVKKQTNDFNEITLDQLKTKKIINLKIGDFFLEKIDSKKSKEFNRLAIIKAGQIIRQYLIEAEKESVLNEYLPSRGEIMYGEVDKVLDNFLIIKINDTSAIIPKNKLITNEKFYIGDPISFLAENIVSQTQEVQIQGTRVADGFLTKLLEVEIPEILEEIVVIKGVSRNPGFRSKVAVSSTSPDVEPVGTCIGYRGTRINVVSQQLNNEKIDVCAYEDNIEKFIINCFNPVKVIMILKTEQFRNVTFTDENGEKKAKTQKEVEAFVVVPSEQLYLAFGFKGKNVQMITHLTKANITVVGYEQAIIAGVDINWNGNITPEGLTDLKMNLSKFFQKEFKDNGKAILLKRLQTQLQEVDKLDSTDLEGLNDDNKKDKT